MAKDKAEVRGTAPSKEDTAATKRILKPFGVYMIPDNCKEPSWCILRPRYHDTWGQPIPTKKIAVDKQTYK